MDSPQVPGTARTSSSDISDLTNRMSDFLRKNTNTPVSDSVTTTNNLPTINIRLNGSNYGLWSQSMKLIITGRGRSGYITGKIISPAITEPAYDEWEQSDSAVRSWILGAMDPALVGNFISYPTAKSLWEALATTYHDGKDTVQLFELRKKVNQTKQNGGIIDQYFVTLQGYWREIDLRRPNLMKTDEDIHTYNQIIQEERLYIFLDGLDDKLDATRRDILNTHPVPSLAEAYDMVRREIRRQTVMNDGGIPDQMAGGVGLAMKSRSDSQSLPREFFPASPWNKSGNNKRNANAQKCEHCGGSKHTKETCFKIHGFPEWWSEYQKKKKGDSGKVAVSAASGNTENVASGGWKPQTQGTEQRQARAAVLIGIEQTEEATGGKARELRVALISQKDKNGPLFCDIMGQLIYDDLGSVNQFSRPGIKIAGSFSGPNTIANGPELLSNVLHCRPEISNSDYIAIGSNATVSIETNLSQSNKGEEWILDSGATDHMTFSRQDISQITQPRKSSVFNANGIPYPVSGAGSIELTPTLKLSNVLLVPSLSNKLLSVSQLDTPQPSPDTNDHEVSIPEPSPEPEYTIESVPPNPTGYVLPQRINRGIPPKRNPSIWSQIRGSYLSNGPAIRSWAVKCLDGLESGENLGKRCWSCPLQAQIQGHSASNDVDMDLLMRMSSSHRTPDQRDSNVRTINSDHQS
ncbi:hypothetical protein ACH5RR_034098 [Cinchona calisaya]|uniref:Retrotransposon Copia-like N-terminal domain-containing protein n=1 Tax=Cinchona calisaya TaxID=153742 RepID=A0ABD2YEG8_9GENT